MNVLRAILTRSGAALFALVGFNEFNSNQRRRNGCT
jgi:hypothetical protein